MSLWDDLTSWIDPTVDWVAEAVGYVDDYSGTGEDAFFITAGEQLVDDVKDVVGFAKKGYKVYSEVSGLYDKQTGKRTDKPYFTQPSFRKQARSVGDLTSGSRAYMRASPITGSPVNIGYANPDVRSNLKQLAQSSYNQQMNNMFSSYLVSPTKTSGQKTIGIGSTTVKGTSAKTKTKTARSQRGLG